MLREFKALKTIISWYDNKNQHVSFNKYISIYINDQDTYNKIVNPKR